MKYLEWPADLVPYAMNYYLQPHTGGTESPFSRVAKTYGLSAPRWVCRMSFRGGYWGDDGLEAVGPRLEGLITQLKGGQNRISIPDFRRNFRGAGGGINDATGKGATSMRFTGVEPFAVFARAGDHIGGDDRSHIITADVEADGSGVAVVRFEPPLLRGIAEGRVVLGSPRSWFRLVDDDALASPSEVGQAVTYDFSFVEDIGDGLPARAYAGDEPTALVMDFSTESAEQVFWIEGGETKFAGSFRAFLDAFGGTFNAFQGTRSVTNANGETVTTSAGEIPFTYETGERMLAVQAADNFAINPAHFTWSNTVTLAMETIHTSANDGLWSFFNSDNSRQFYAGTDAAHRLTLGWWKSGTSPSNLDNFSSEGGLTVVGEETPVVVRIEQGNHAVMFWNEIPKPMDRDNIFTGYGAISPFTPARMRIVAGNRTLVRRIILLGRAVSDEEMSGLVGPRIKAQASRLLGKFKGTYATDSAELIREAGQYIFNNGSEVVEYVAFNLERHGGHAAGETPRRIVGRTARHVRGSETIQLGPRRIIAQPPGWTVGTGDYSSYATGRRTYGPRKGRATMLFASVVGQDVVGPAIEHAIWNTAMIETGDNFTGSNYSPEIVLTAADIGGGSYMIPSPGSRILEFPQGSAFTGREVAMITDNSTPRVAYRDEGGVWQLGAKLTGKPGGTPSYDEWWGVLTPAGIIVGFCRIGGTNNQTAVIASTDGGATLQYVKTLTAADGYQGAFSPASAVQLDMAGVYGPMGRIIFANALPPGSSPSNGLRINYLEGSDPASLAIQQTWDAAHLDQSMRGNMTDPIFGGSQLLITGEFSMDSSSNFRGSSYTGVFLPPRRAV